MFQKYLIFFLNFSLLLLWVQGDCILNIEDNSPLLVKDFGSRKIVLNKDIRSVELNEGETIFAYCSTNLRLICEATKFIDFKESIRKTILLCNPNDRVAYKIPEAKSFIESDPYYNNRIYVGCSSKQDQQLYESHKALPNCEKYLSYGIGTTLPTTHKDIVTAAICYDLNALQLKYATYFAYRPKYEIISDKRNYINPAVGLDDQLNNFDNYFSFPSQQFFNISYYSMKNSQHLLNLFDFDYMNLVQDKPLENALSDYLNLFNIVWWRNLRLGNWRNFLNTFEERTKEINYLVYTGASGIVEMPTATSTCNKTQHLYIEAEKSIVTVPEYIWSYLISVHENISEAIVVIGYNSPFYQQNNAATFCRDICNEIDWLKSSLFGKLRLMPTMGLMFCCRPEEIGQYLDNFPHDAVQILKTTTAQVLSSETVAPTTTTTTTTTIDPFELYDN